MASPPAAANIMSDPFTSEASARLAARTGDPAWLAEVRSAAFSLFSSLPWPDGTEEEWRHTDLSGLDFTSLTTEVAAPTAVGGLDAVPAQAQDALGVVGDRAGLAVHVDAVAVHQSLDPSLAARGVIFTSLARAATEHEELVKAWLGRCGVSGHEAKIVALNSAFRGDGVFVYVPAGVEVAFPIQTLHWLSREGVLVCPRVVVVAEESSSITYIDVYTSAALKDPSVNASAVEIYAAPSANVSYLAVQDLAQSVWHFHVQRAVIDRDASVRSLAVTLGGRMSRSLVESLLDGRGAHSEMLGVYFGDHEQHIDNRSLQAHRAPDTTSELYYKGALKGSSHAVYSGLVHITKGAQKSDAQQTNRNLLLSDGAIADPKPFLEIETNDVRCSHAVSVGRPDDEVLFYLQSRGLSAADAERLYVKGFFQEVLDRVSVPEMRTALERAVEDELALEDSP
ncbi:MAG: Fe-S cluster assembly protein SufD [Actinomycetota bacterium]